MVIGTAVPIESMARYDGTDADGVGDAAHEPRETGNRCAKLDCSR